MKRTNKTKLNLTVSLLFALFTSATFGQSFSKGTFLISASGGNLKAKFSTKSNSLLTGEISNYNPSPTSELLDGIRDPLFIEYGLTNKIGIGLTSGGDIWNVDALKFYGIYTDKNNVFLTTSEFTFDIDYHLFVTNRLDLSLYTSMGFFSAGFNEEYKSEELNYYAEGYIYRFGTSLRLYLFKRFSLMAMLSNYTSSASPKYAELNNLNNNITTKINGWAIETGLSIRIGKANWEPIKWGK